LDKEYPQFDSFHLKLVLKGLSRTKPHCPKQAQPITPKPHCPKQAQPITPKPHCPKKAQPITPKPHCPKQAQPIIPKLLCDMLEIFNHKHSYDATFWYLFVHALFLMFRKSNLVPDSVRSFNGVKQSLHLIKIVEYY
jgi:hypothetical protein